ncbi:glycerol kinase [Sphingorhabdus lutea]|uniref:Glycerol kinase n=1 Tax=Sphingorhabdus lutea TaxID=1913578 RepID=A0A1L3J9N7_9SPHN|nr:glycerol kinase GlpK [Sphingorhabdus lutea]APG61838.1 glycerol kinase [Sphingorhabdus lutea]
MSQYILVIDEGTTSTRAILFSPMGEMIASAQKPLTQHYPAPGLVEHDAEEIWQHSLSCATQMVNKAGGAQHIIAIAITNQRETIIFWDRRTGKPVAPAIVWQDRRTADICATLKDAGHEKMVQEKSGLLLDPYFSGSKIGWALENWPQLKQLGENLAVGTVESYLTYRLTGGLHITDASNASRTALMSIGQNGGWDDDLLNIFNVPQHILPEISDCAGQLGHSLPDIFGGAIPICGMAGDQQAATIGQGCLAKGQTKATFGTGAFILTQSGTERPYSDNKLLSTIAWQLNGERHYALEGSVFVAGSLMQWMRDDMQIIAHAGDSEALAKSVPDNGGVFLVPALSGLGAPYWNPHARGIISGLSFAATKAHIVRAGLEAMAHQAHDLKTAYAADGCDWGELRIDGGMVSNDWMAQDLADILNIGVERPYFIETTALGAAMLAAVGANLYQNLNEAAIMRGKIHQFTPNMTEQSRQNRLDGWTKAVALAMK